MAKTILIAEDDQDYQFLIQLLLRENGFQGSIVIVVDGLELMNFLNKGGEEKTTSRGGPKLCTRCHGSGSRRASCAQSSWCTASDRCPSKLNIVPWSSSPPSCPHMNIYR